MNMQNVWRVTQGYRFVGYVVHPSMYGAQMAAQRKFGSGCLIERFVLSNPTDLAGVAVVSQKPDSLDKRLIPW